MKTLRILHLEDNALDAFFVRRALEQNGLNADIVLIGRPEAFLEEIDRGSIDLILCDNGLPGLSGDTALEVARQRQPKVPFIFLTGTADEGQVTSRLKQGATGRHHQGPVVAIDQCGAPGGFVAGHFRRRPPANGSAR